MTGYTLHVIECVADMIPLTFYLNWATHKCSPSLPQLCIQGALLRRQLQIDALVLLVAKLALPSDALEWQVCSYGTSGDSGDGLVQIVASCCDRLRSLS